MIEYIKDVHGFEDEDITVLMDDGEHTEPTRENILAAYDKLVQETKEGDVVFCHYSGTYSFSVYYFGWVKSHMLLCTYVMRISLLRAWWQAPR